MTPRHAIDEEATARNLARMQEAVGDILPVIVDRAPAYRMWEADISTHLALPARARAVHVGHDGQPGVAARAARLHARRHPDGAGRGGSRPGDWRLCDHQNQAMPYAEELADPAPTPRPVTRKQLWGFCAAQEFTLVSPAMHDEFMLQYQLPILEKFGLVAYGCCEDLTEKIDMLRQIPNLRRIAVTPLANVRRCAEQIGTDYVFSWRPNPAEMVCCGFDPDHVRTATAHGAGRSRGLPRRHHPQRRGDRRGPARAPARVGAHYAGSGG